MSFISVLMVCSPCSGCYYYSTGRQDPARRYLEKATKQDVMFGPAWLAYGHSFAVENEHDQAMAAYFKVMLASDWSRQIT